MSLRSSEAELVIGLVSRIGIDNRSVNASIKKLLKEYNYQVIEIKATDAITEIDQFSTLDLGTTEKRYKSLITACDSLREKTNSNDIMAKLAVSRIAHERSKIDPSGSRLHRIAYVVNQLKRKEESELLRSLYGEHYVQIACHAKRSIREKRLCTLISNDNPRKPKGSSWALQAGELIQTDEAEDDNFWGQRLRDVFPMSDIVINASSRAEIMPALDRFFRALFGDPRITPTPDEYGMQLARTASLRSADLSRQVGAAILNSHQEIQALGCNEVPRFGGGTYWEGDDGDQREFQLDKDSNEERKREVLQDLIGRLVDAGVIRDESNDPKSLTEKIFNREDDLISASQLMDSLEYGRSIHAEMNAITDAARGGHAIRGCILYCNTFPCHNCAKHIVASGISKVVYGMPFTKSYAEDLFDDSISVDPDIETSDRLLFTPFIGVSGLIFGRIFEKRRWKNSDGSVPAFSKFTATFVRNTPAPAYAEAEAILREDVTTSFAEAGLTVRQPAG